MYLSKNLYYLILLFWALGLFHDHNYDSFSFLANLRKYTSLNFLILLKMKNQNNLNINP